MPRSNRTSPSETGLLTPRHAAELLGVTTKTLTRMAERGDIKAYRLPSGHYRYDRASIEALLEERSA